MTPRTTLLGWCFWLAWTTLVAACLLLLAVTLAAHGPFPQPFHIDGRT